MSQAGFTPIKLYSSTTPTVTPTAGNLEQGELAINTADGKLFYEDSSGVVQVLATKDAAAGNFTTLDATNLEVTNLKAKDGTAAGSIANATGIVTLASSVLTTTDINGGTIDGTVIGGVSAAAGTFTTATATTGNITTVNATTVDTTNIEVTNLKAKDGTAAGSIANATGIVTLASSVLTTADINGGTIDATSIGATTPSTVVATQVDITAQGDLRLQDTTGGQFVALQAPSTIATSYTLTLPVDDGTAGQALITNGSGVLSWSTAASGDVVGPASATDNAIARYDGTTGKIIQNSVVTIADTTGDMTGVGTLGVAAGTVLLPAITQTGDTNTGMYFPAADTIGFAAGGVQGFSVGTTASAVNYLEARGAATTAAPRIVSLGTDTNVPIAFVSKGTGDIRFTTNAIERMRIDGSGNVGIGTSSPSLRLSVASSTNNDGIDITNASNANTAAKTTRITFSGTDTAGTKKEAANIYVIPGEAGYSNTVMAFYTRSADVVAERMRLSSAGNLYIGTTAPATAQTKVAIEWNASTQYGLSFKTTSATYSAGPILFLNSVGAVVGNISQSESIVSYNSASDYRLKENVLPMTGALAKVAALKPVTYTWKLDGSSGQGFIAHELQEVVPDCVTGAKDAVDENGNIRPQGVDTSFLVATLTAAIQEQQAIISAMEARLAALEA